MSNGETCYQGRRRGSVWRTKKISFVLSALPLFDNSLSDKVLKYLNFIEEKKSKLVHRDKRKLL